jgi:small-conductance mechanosensitive channel
MLSTKIRTVRNEEINVPNAVMVGTTLKNYTRLNRDTGVPVTTTLTIGYGNPWRQVHAMLLEAAEKTVGLRADPAPFVLQTALSDFFVEYTLIARLEVPQTRGLVLSQLHANIQDIFNVHGVQIMSPHYEGDPDGKVWVPKEKWYEKPAGQDDGPLAKPGPKGTS